jgi:chromosome condensin MukBEF MukE localization factor
LFSLFILSSCGGSLEGDAQKIADLQCRAQKLTTKVASGDQSVMEESLKLTAEATSLMQEMERKYTSDADKKKLGEAVLKAMAGCK